MITSGVVGVAVGVLLMAVASGEPQGFLQANVPGNFNPNRNQPGNTGTQNRQGGSGISFAIPGLSLLGGGNNGLGGGLFGVATFTRTLVSTVSTVTTASFRTCVTTAGALMPCAAGRRRRDAADAMIQPTPAMELIIPGSTTIRDPEAVSEYLEAHKSPSASIIYPPGVEHSMGAKINPRFNNKVEVMADEATTVLYPSLDNPEREEAGYQVEEEIEDKPQQNLAADDESSGVTTETPELVGEEEGGSLRTTTEISDDDKEISADQARAGLGRTTTVTTVIRVTSVATTLATGGMTATLTVMYTGCLPQSLPLPLSGGMC